ncbi:protein phosphatase 2C 29 [Sesamum alatum]|uniref:Protein phosphatase 2C 29 n=1 Tax=Sesamum alatum TaxID=300844 RepID=A0AAE2CI21_9LAMI|nr:protein phosphatase 2C 29 [Sesamum alatum]
MGAGFSQVFPCFNPAAGPNRSDPDVIFTANAPLDETLGHSFCYVRSSARFISPTQSDRFVSPSQSLRFDDPAHPRPSRPPGYPETGFRAISGASVSANTSTPITVLQLDDICDDATDAANSHYHNNATNSSSSKGFVGGPSRVGGNSVLLDGFESTSSFSALPLQRVPRGGEPPSGPLERAFFMSGPIERGALSGPLDGTASGDNNGGVPFSAPLGGVYVKKRKKKSISGIRKALYRNFSVVPVRNFISGGGGRKDALPGVDSCREAVGMGCESNEQWALGKAGEDRVHVVVSEELGWLFVGIYDGFNGPDAPEFLMSHLYKAMYNELEGLFWDTEDLVETSQNADVVEDSCQSDVNTDGRQGFSEAKEGEIESQLVKKVMFGGEQIEVRRRRLWEYLVEDDPEEGLDLSGSERFAFSVDDALSVNDAGSAVSRRSLLLSKLKHGLLNRNKEKESIRLFPWRFWLEGKQKAAEEMRESNVADDGEAERERISRIGKKRKVGLVNHESVLSAMSRALEVTEQAYLDMTDRVLDRYPELALMGSCLLVALMRDDDVYVMNVGDSRAIVAQYEPEEVSCGTESQGAADDGFSGEGIIEESTDVSNKESKAVNEAQAHQSMSLTALQLSTDHSTSIEEEVIRIKNEHPDDNNCIVNDRVKGRLKVTRAFGAGFLKKHKWNDVLLEMFRNDYIGTAPYISCSPSLRHHKLCPRDQFLVLSSDGLYQYFSNQEVVSHVQNFMERFPDGDPAQHLIEELLFRAARKAGMDFHELLDIPQGDRRKYHDDVTVMVVSLEGRIWKSSGKYL